MERKKKSSPPETPEPRDSYFEIQAALGITKHMGGFKATDKLVELCHIDRDKYVLVIGCGVGITPGYLAKKHGCRVTGIDISEEMVERSRERAKKVGVADRVEFRKADAQNLPYDEATFDAVFCESVNAFIPDRPRALSEYRRVTKPGGYVGFNEVTWLKEPPRDMVAYLHRVMGGDFLTRDRWRGLLEDSGLGEIVSLVYRTNVIGQWTGEQAVRIHGFLQGVVQVPLPARAEPGSPEVHQSSPVLPPEYVSSVRILRLRTLCREKGIDHSGLTDYLPALDDDPGKIETRESEPSTRSPF